MKFASAALLSAMLGNGWLVPGPEETMQMTTESLPTAEPVAASSVKWKKKPPAQDAADALGFVIQAPEPPRGPTPEAAPSTSWKPATPKPQLTEQPSQPADQGHALCSCGAVLSPEELVPHMKAHALNGESHSYSV